MDNPIMGLCVGGLFAALLVCLTDFHCQDGQPASVLLRQPLSPLHPQQPLPWFRAGSNRTCSRPGAGSLAAVCALCCKVTHTLGNPAASMQVTSVVRLRAVRGRHIISKQCVVSFHQKAWGKQNPWQVPAPCAGQSTCSMLHPPAEQME